MRAAAPSAGVTVVIGVNERGRHSMGVLYNTVLTIAPTASCSACTASWCRPGPRSSPGRAATAARCGSTTPSSARSACWPAARTPTRWPASPCSPRASRSTWPATSRCRSRRRLRHGRRDRDPHGRARFEGKIFSVVACSTISPEIIDAIAGDDAAARDQLARKRNALSGDLRARRPARRRTADRRRGHRLRRDRPRPLHPAQADARHRRPLQPLRRLPADRAGPAPQPSVVRAEPPGAGRRPGTPDGPAVTIAPEPRLRFLSRPATFRLTDQLVTQLKEQLAAGRLSGGRQAPLRAGADAAVRG